MRISDWSSDVCSSDLATYSARAEFRARTIGAKTPNRADMQRCQWTATILVDRALSHGPALSRTVSSDKQFSGSEHGACTPGRQSGERNLARHEGEIRDHLIAVAQADRAPLLAALDAVRNLASNRSEEHTSELQSLMSLSYAAFC